MSENTPRRPSPSLVISMIALLVAMSGTAMALQRNSVKSQHIKNGQVGTADLGKNAVRGNRLANDTVKGKHVRDDSLTGADIDESTLVGGGPGAPPSGPAGGGLTGNYPNPGIKNNSITGTQVRDGTLTGDDIFPSSLGGSDLAANSIDSGHIKPDNVRGVDVNEASLGEVPRADTLDGHRDTFFGRRESSAAIGANGSLVASHSTEAGGFAAFREAEGRYFIRFPHSVGNWMPTVTPNRAIVHVNTLLCGNADPFGSVGTACEDKPSSFPSNSTVLVSTFRYGSTTRVDTQFWLSLSQMNAPY